MPIGRAEPEWLKIAPWRKNIGKVITVKFPQLLMSVTAEMKPSQWMLAASGDGSCPISPLILWPTSCKSLVPHKEANRSLVTFTARVLKDNWQILKGTRLWAFTYIILKLRSRVISVKCSECLDYPVRSPWILIYTGSVQDQSCQIYHKNGRELVSMAKPPARLVSACVHLPGHGRSFNMLSLVVAPAAQKVWTLSNLNNLVVRSK